MSLSRRALLATAAATATTPIIGAGCGSSGTTLGKTTARKVDEVTYITGFGTFGREGYVVVADARGYFAEQRLKVRIKPGAAGEVNLSLLRTGKAQFATVDWSGVVVRAGLGQFGDLRAVAAQNPATLISIMVLAEQGITHPGDLAGRTIGQATGAVPKTLFPAYATLAKFDASRVRWVQGAPQNLPAWLATRKVDGIGQFVAGEPAVAAAAKPRRVTVLPYSDYLGDLYGNTLVTTARIAEQQHDLVRRFTLALMRGLRDAVDHPEQAGQIIHQRWSSTPAAVAAAELRLLRAYVAPQQPGHGLGSFDPAKVARGDLPGNRRRVRQHRRVPRRVGW